MTFTDKNFLNLDLIGYWSFRRPSKYHKTLILIYRSCTSCFLLIILLQTILNLRLVLVAAFLIATSFIVVLDAFSPKFPQLTFPISQTVLFILPTYMQFFILFSQQSSFLDNPNFSVFPDLFGFLLGIVSIIRIIIGIELIRVNRDYKNARVPLSNYNKENLSTFEKNMQLTSSEIQNEFKEEPVRVRMRFLFIYVFFTIILMFILLIPL
ncbi:MAG: hypothetical protein ACXACR_04305, partial [Candidatus Hodarchaeales archaeon]